MTISAKVIADSISSGSPRLTTLQLRYPRFIHAEFMTHRDFSRNASSSRAIPVERLIQDVLDDTAMPIHWGKNQKGMQADEEHNAKMVFDWYDSGHPIPERILSREETWNEARDQAIIVAREFAKAGYHKQIVNRLLEPFSHINVVVSSTRWANFFALRDHPDAQPEIRELAIQMKHAMDDSTPRQMGSKDGWHLPYVTRGDYLKAQNVWRTGQEDRARNLAKISAARCARVSYMTHDNRKPNFEEDMELFNRLVGGELIHASPTEHQARVGEFACYINGKAHWHDEELHGNFDGWCQHRKMIPGEYIHD